MNKKVYKEGHEKTVYQIFCPHCVAEGESDEVDQYPGFNLEEISEDGLGWVWKCETCGKKFQTRIK